MARVAQRHHVAWFIAQMFMLPRFSDVMDFSGGFNVIIPHAVSTQGVVCKERFAKAAPLPVIYLVLLCLIYYGPVLFAVSSVH